MPLSKSNQNTEGRKALDVVQKVNAQRTGWRMNKMSILIDSGCLKHHIEKDSVISFNFIRTENHERHMPIMRTR